MAPMSPRVLTLTLVILALPAAFLAAPLLGGPTVTVPAILMIAIFAWVWLRFRPSCFVVYPKVLQIVWPLKRREIPRREILGARIIGRKELKQEIGSGLRVGAGGLWGGFGWLWTRKRGIVQMYVSRTDRFVWIEHAGGKPWLITPEQPETFVRTLSARDEPMSSS